MNNIGPADDRPQPSIQGIWGRLVDAKTVVVETKGGTVIRQYRETLVGSTTGAALLAVCRGKVSWFVFVDMCSLDSPRDKIGVVY